MAKKVTLDELKKNSKSLNKLDLTDEPVDTDTDDVEELAEDFMNAMEEIDDDGKTDEVDKKIIKFYVRVMNQFDEDGDNKNKGTTDDLREELEEMELKEIKAYIEENEIELKTKVTKKNLAKVIDEIVESTGSSDSDDDDEDEDDNDGEFNRDDLEEKLGDMEYKDVKAFVKNNELDIDMPKKKDWEDESEDTIDEILDAMEEKSDEDQDDDDDEDDNDGEFDRDDLEEKLGDMKYGDIKAFVKNNELDIDMPKKKDWEDESEDTIDEILDAMEEKAESKDKKGKKSSNKKKPGDKGKKTSDKKDKGKGGKKSGGKKDKSANKDKKDKGDNLPKGMRKDSLPAKIYQKVKKDGPVTIMDIAKLCAKEKPKNKPEQLINFSVRTIAKSVAKSCAINILYDNSGGVEDGVVSLVED